MLTKNNKDVIERLFLDLSRSTIEQRRGEFVGKETWMGKGSHGNAKH